MSNPLDDHAETGEPITIRLHNIDGDGRNDICATVTKAGAGEYVLTPVDHSPSA